MELYLNNKLVFNVAIPITLEELSSRLNIPDSDYYLLSNGKRLYNRENELKGKIELVYRLIGGKGGFGSMLRAIGAQIEKTTNREACRDLSGRRLRDINEEQRLKNWISQQADREREAAEKKQKKLERLIEQPKHEFKDEDYDNLRSSLPEKVEDAVIQGMRASCSTKRKHVDGKAVKKKKPKLWIDEELSTSGSDESDEDEESHNSDNKSGVSNNKETVDDKWVSKDSGKQKLEGNKTVNDEIKTKNSDNKLLLENSKEIVPTT